MFHRRILKASLGEMSKRNVKSKTFHEGKNKTLRSLVVSLDNADTVIEGAPGSRPVLGG